MDEQVLKIFSRLKDNADGIEFVSFLKTNLNNMTQALYISEGNKSEYLKGYCTCLNELIKVFESCDDKLVKSQVKDKEWM